MVSGYDPSRWYWEVNGIVDRVFSSAEAMMVPLTDAGYEAWLAAGNNPSVIGRTAGLSADAAYAELYDVLRTQVPSVAAAVAGEWMEAGYLTRAHEFEVLNAAGVEITSNGTPAISGTYAIDLISQGRIQALALYIQVHDGFPNAASTLQYPDRAGNLHVFPSTASFLNFATAVGDYFTALVTAELTSDTWPSNAKTIA